MYNIQISNGIHLLVKIFHRFGMWYSEEESIFHQTARQLIYLILLCSFAIFTLTGGLLSNDWSECVFLCNAAASISVTIVKLTYILCKKEKTREFIQNIGAHSVADHGEFVKVKNKLNRLMKFSCSLSLVICISIGSLFTFCLPLFSDQRRLPVNLWFPLYWKNNVIFYWVAYAFVAIGTTISVVAASLNIIIWYLMMNCAIKYQILGNQFRNICLTKPTIRKRKISKEDDKIFLQELIGLIKTHRNTQEYNYYDNLKEIK